MNKKKITVIIIIMIFLSIVSLSIASFTEVTNDFTSDPNLQTESGDSTGSGHKVEYDGVNDRLNFEAYRSTDFTYQYYSIIDENIYHDLEFDANLNIHQAGSTSLTYGREMYVYLFDSDNDGYTAFRIDMDANHVTSGKLGLQAYFHDGANTVVTDYVEVDDESTVTARAYVDGDTGYIDVDGSTESCDISSLSMSNNTYDRIRFKTGGTPTASDSNGLDGWIDDITYRASTVNIVNPYPNNNDYNVSLTQTYNVTVNDDRGRSSTVDFYISTDNSSWTHLQTNNSVLNESVSVDLTGELDYDTVYYMKTTANNTDEVNRSFISSFETTPYTTDYFNTSFPSENWIQSSTNMSFENSYYNTIASGDTGSGYIDCYVHMKGDDYGGDGVEILAQEEDDSWTTLWSRNTEWDSDWHNLNISLENYTSATQKIRLQHSGATSWSADAAFDDVSIGYTGTILDIEGFESSLGDWSNVGTGDWERKSGGTGSSGTGPSSAYEGSYYVYTECSNDANDNTFTLETTVDLRGSIVGGVVDASIISDNITKQNTNWDKFYVDVNNIQNSTFSLIDPLTDYTIISSLNGDGDDISSVSNNTVRVRGDFNATLSLDSINLTWTSAAANNAPTITGENPSNQSTGISLQPTCNVTVSDADGDSMNVTFASNHSGSWTNYQTNTSVSSGSSVSWSFTDADSYDTTYYWRVYADDGTDNTSETFSFTTESEKPELTNPSVSPTNGIASYTIFYFNVTWTHLSKTPADGYLNVNISRDGWYDNSSMSYVSGDNTTGAVYTYSTSLSASSSYNYTFYAYDGTNYNSSGPHDNPDVESQSLSFTITTSSDPNLDFKDWVLSLTGVGLTTQYNVSEDNQTGSLPALNITNTGNIPLNFSLNWSSDPGSGIIAKWNTTDNAPFHGTNTVAEDPSSTQVITDLQPMSSEEIWLWMDFTDVQAQESSANIQIVSWT